MNLLLSISYKQEIFTFFLAVCILELVYRLVDRKQRVFRSNVCGQLVILVLAVYFTGVCHFTLLHRDVKAGMQYELSLFWSYRMVVEENSRSFFAEVVYNILLLFPMGAFIPLYLKPFRRFRYTLLAGFACSCVIELCQLVFHIGLFEFDDIFNNTMGAAMGYSVYYLGACIARKTGDDKWIRKLTLLLIGDACVLVYFWRLWVMIE